MRKVNLKPIAVKGQRVIRTYNKYVVRVDGKKVHHARSRDHLRRLLKRLPVGSRAEVFKSDINFVQLLERV